MEVEGTGLCVGSRIRNSPSWDSSKAFVPGSVQSEWYEPHHLFFHQSSWKSWCPHFTKKKKAQKFKVMTWVSGSNEGTRGGSDLSKAATLPVKLRLLAHALCTWIVCLCLFLVFLVVYSPPNMWWKREVRRRGVGEREKERACFLGAPPGPTVTLPAWAQPDFICKATLRSLSLSSLNGHLTLSG